MRYLYFVRHGQSVWNAENKICGAVDIPLSAQGHLQAQETGRRILESGISFDEILSSPLQRAAETARHISEMTGVPMRTEARLTEQAFGRYEGAPRDSEEFQLSKEHFADRYDGGESMLHLAQRVYNLLDELKHDPEGKTYMLVAHKGIGRAVNSYFYSMTNREYARFRMENCSVLTYTFGEQ